MRYGLVIPTGDPRTVADLAHQFEEHVLGFGVFVRHPLRSTEHQLRLVTRDLTVFPRRERGNVSQRSSSVSHIPVGSPTRHTKPVFQIGHHRRIPHHIVVTRSVADTQSLDPLHIQLMTGRLEKHQMLITFVYRCCSGIIESGNDDRHPLVDGGFPSHIQNVQTGCDKKSVSPPSREAVCPDVSP